MKLKKYNIIGFVFTLIFGSILHFTYKLFEGNALALYFSAVNESTWEHLKLLITPSLLFFIFEYFKYGKKLDNFLIVKALSILIGMLSIVVLFYTYTGIIGKNYLALDILIFIYASFISYYFSYKMLKNDKLIIKNGNYIGFFIIFLIIFSVIYFTINPPKINLFLDPIKNIYGVG